jgi:hypothetical protein
MLGEYATKYQLVTQVVCFYPLPNLMATPKTPNSLYRLPWHQ